MLGPRLNVATWDDTWMTMAKVIARRSKDPNSQVGAVLVNIHNHMIGAGYNGFPRGCPSNQLPWDREGDPLNTKYMYVGHAEANCIDNADKSQIEGSKLYVSLFPCNQCAIRIIQNRISEVIYLSDKYHDTDGCIAARKMFDMAGIKTRKFIAEIDTITIKLKDES